MGEAGRGGGETDVRARGQSGEIAALGRFGHPARRGEAELEAVTYNEWLPALLGPNGLRPYAGYNPNVNAGISNEFAAAAFRLGHSMLGDDVEFLNDQGQRHINFYSGRVKPLGIPAWRGAQFGHVERQLTLPLGLRVEVDAEQGTIRMLERAVA